MPSVHAFDRNRHGAASVGSIPPCHVAGTDKTNAWAWWPRQRQQGGPAAAMLRYRRKGQPPKECSSKDVRFSPRTLHRTPRSSRDTGAARRPAHLAAAPQAAPLGWPAPHARRRGPAPSSARQQGIGGGGGTRSQAAAGQGKSDTNSPQAGVVDAPQCRHCLHASEHANPRSRAKQQAAALTWHARRMQSSSSLSPSCCAAFSALPQ